MEVRATEDIPIGQDLTPPIPPLAAALHDATISTHCSACFRPLPPLPFVPNFPQNPRQVPTLLYCSLHCSSVDSHLHFSSAEPNLFSVISQSPLTTWNDSADLRLSLRLIHLFEKLISAEVNSIDPVQENENRKCSGGNFSYRDGLSYSMKRSCNKGGAFERIAGLMTNWEFVFEEKKDDPHLENGNGKGLDRDFDGENMSFLKKIVEGAKAIALAKRMHEFEDPNLVELEELLREKMMLCLVLTNAVEVQDRSGSSIGVAVYGTTFSWINHSCSPNAVYRFSMEDLEAEQKLRIYPALMENNSNSKGNVNQEIIAGITYGPRVIIRSIKPVRESEEVTIAYTDLMQPKQMRQQELWLKYRFSCGCKRCSSVPSTYVDWTLQVRVAICTITFNSKYVTSDDNMYRDEEIKKLMDCFDDAISEYTCSDDPISCCKKLENLLTYGYTDEQLLYRKETEFHHRLKLHPCNHLAINAYTTLASAYKVRATDVIALNPVSDGHKLEAFNMHRTSAAYSLLLAGVTHHLFTFETSLMACAANFWTIVGEALLDFAQNSLWNLFLKMELVDLETSSVSACKCPECPLLDKFDNLFQSDQIVQLEDITGVLFGCISKLTSNVWRLLNSESSYLKGIENPIDFSWLEFNNSTVYDSGCLLSGPTAQQELSRYENEHTEKDKIELIKLGMHCLRYGAILSGICFKLCIHN